MKARFVLASVLLLAPLTGAQDLLQQVSPPNSADGLGFGSNIAQAGGFVAIGTGAYSPGGVNVFRNTANGLVLHDTLFPPAGALGFGSQLAMSGNRIVVGASRSSGGVGAAYVYRVNSGGVAFEQQLHPGVAESGSFFGGAVDIDGNRIVVGAHGADVGGNQLAGAVYFFARTGASWTLDGSFPAGTLGQTAVGREVGISGNIAVIGAPFEAAPGNGQGKAWVVNRSAGTWQLETELIPSEGQAEDHFASDLDIDGDRIVVGASGFDQGGEFNTGAAFVFERMAGVWAETQKLVSPHATPGADLGARASLSGDRILLGAPLLGQDNGGGAVAFGLHAGVWREFAVLSATDLDDVPLFGFGISLGPDMALVGAPSFDGQSFNDGVVQLFQLDPGTVRYCVGSPNSVGGAALIEARGSRSVTENQLLLRASPVPSTPGFFAYATRRAHAPFALGVRCIGGASIFALPLQSGMDFQLEQILDFTSLPAGGAILPGTRWNFQAYYLDALGGIAGLNSSDAVSVEFRL